MKKKSIDRGFIISLMYIVGVILLMTGFIGFRVERYTEYENSQDYQVSGLNSDKNIVIDEEAYFYGYDNAIYRYDFKTGKTKRLCEFDFPWNGSDIDPVTNGRFEFVIYEDYVFCVENNTSESAEHLKPKMHRYNYRTGEDEVLLEDMPAILEIDICNGYLVYRTYKESNYYLYPATGSAGEEPIAVESIFEERGDKTNSDIQIVTYEGIDFVGCFDSVTGEADIISVREQGRGKEVLPRYQTFLLLDDGRPIAFEKGFEDGDLKCYMLYLDGHDDLEKYEISRIGDWVLGSPLYGIDDYHDDLEKYEITCFNEDNVGLVGLSYVVFGRHMIQEGDEIICLLQRADVYGDGNGGRKRIVYGDTLFKWNMKTGESSILYQSSKEEAEYTRVIGYKAGEIYLLHDRWVSVLSVDGENQKRLFKIPRRKEIHSFNWQGDHLIVTGANGEVLKAYKIE